MKSPRYSEARAVLPPRKSEISFGITGATTPKASMSSSTVTKMKPRAACRLANMGCLLQVRSNGVERIEPEIDGAVRALTVVRGAVIEHETAKSGNHDGGEGAGVFEAMAFADERRCNKLQPIADRGA